MDQKIELDCAPFHSPRPGDLLPQIIAGTGLVLKDPASKIFGNWIWDYSEVDATIWALVTPILNERITDLYLHGKIRYGSW